MTFRELQDDVLDRCEYTSGGTVQPFVRERVKRVLNIWHRKLLSKPQLSRLRDRVTTLTSSTSTSGMHVLPPSVARISRLYDPAMRIRLFDRTLDWIRMLPDGGTDTGDPVVYVPLGLQATLQVPASTGLWAASTSALDVTQQVSVEAVRSAGYSRTPTPVTLTGTTRVAIDSAITDFVDVLKFWVDGQCSGDIKLYDAAAAGNVIAVIPLGENSSKYQGILLFPTPASSVVYTMEYQIRIPTMFQEHDEPFLPEDFHDVLTAAARYEELLLKEKATAMAILGRELEPRIKELTSWVTNLPDTVIVPGADDMPYGSNLGAQFPAGRW